MFYIPEEATEEQLSAIAEDIKELEFIESAHATEDKFLGVTYTRQASLESLAYEGVNEAHIDKIKGVVSNHGFTLREHGN
jgi:hypothetical protein